MSKYSKSSIDKVISKIKKDKVQLIELQFTDYLGNIKSVTIPARDVAKPFTHGVWFDGSSVEGFARVQESDMFLKADPNTYSLLPWRSSLGNGSVARFICDVYAPDGKPFEGDPRFILKKILAEVEKLGLKYFVGPELEFFLFKKDESGKVIAKTKGNGSYFAFSPDKTYEIKREMIETLEAMNIKVEMSHYEVADNQHEIDFRFADALTAADNAITFKYSLKAIAEKHNMYATFMPKPFYGSNGSGMHVHQSLFRNSKNVFYSKTNKYNLSVIAHRFLAGQLNHVREISAIISPTVNSYKRLTPGFEAPVYICWARKNRSALIRIPEFRMGKSDATTIELRCPDTACNPYLAFAVMLKAGLTGIERKTKAPLPVEEDVYHFDENKLKKRSIEELPGSLGEALRVMDKGLIVKQVFGDYVYKRYLDIKKQEWDSYRTWVTDWETKRYLEQH